MNDLVPTREWLHTLAEQLLAGDLYRRTGRIGLRATTGGFGQPEHFVGDVRRRARVDLLGPAGPELVVLRGDVETRSPLTTLAAAAGSADAELGAPPVYAAQTSLDPESPASLDADAARELGRFIVYASDVLEQYRRAVAARTPTIAQLWSEHFDLACSASEVNFGASPGDALHERPYLYVGPWTLPPPGDATDWNETWGRSLTWTPAQTVDEGMAFLSAGAAALWG